MSSYEWKCLKKNTLQRKIKEYPSFEVSNHPLKKNIDNTITSKDNSKLSILTSLDKLSMAFDSGDPLNKFAQENMNEDKDDIVNYSDTAIDFTKLWNIKKNYILHKYTTVEKLTIVSSYLPDDIFTIKHVSNLNEQVKHRLEQLDYFDESSIRKTIGLSQQEYVVKINVLNEELKKAWNEEQRVKAFKIAIQCSKLLSDTSVIQFYPSKFILISDILDTFGDLVYNRLKEKCYEQDKSLSALNEIDPALVPESAKETCQNWLYKMASIRELLPRLYIEMALLRCYAFLSKNEIDYAIHRLTTMIRGIGNPLVAVYLRVYLCHIAMKFTNKNMDCFYKNLKEFLKGYEQIFDVGSKLDYEKQYLSIDVYLELYIPAIDWLLNGTLTSEKSQTDLFEEFFQLCRSIPHNELFLCSIVSSFESTVIIDNVLTILDMIQTNSDQMALTHEILVSIGEHLCKVNSYKQLPSETIIQAWWKLANNLISLHHFLRVLEPWLAFACINLSTKHVNFILRGTIKHLIKSGKSAEEHLALFQSLIKRLIKSVPYVEEIFLMDAFMPLVELIQTANARSDMAKTILTIFFSKFNISNRIMDHIIISSLMRLCCVLHDSITAVTVDDELKLIAELISKFIQSVNFEDNLEQQLNFYVECRSAFIKLDNVLVTLVYAVNSLAVQAGNGSINTWLQRACSAYCFVTVPSLQCCLIKGQLYILSGQVALLNNCLGQAEAFFKVFVGLIPNLPSKQMEDGQLKCAQHKVEALFSDFLSSLLILPDNMDSSYKAYVLNGFLKSVDKIPWTKTDSVYYNTLLFALDLLGNMYQDQYIYHINAVLSNDMLYGADIEFTNAIDTYATNVCKELLVALKLLGDTKQSQKQYNLTLKLFWRVIKRGNVQVTSMASLATKLWMLSQKLQPSDRKFGDNILYTLDEEMLSKFRNI